MTFTELQRHAERLTPQRRTLLLKQLTTETRCAAFIALIEQHHDDYVEAVADQKLAPHHGCLEHAAGSLYALRKLRRELQAIADTPAKTLRKPPGAAAEPYSH